MARPKKPDPSAVNDAGGDSAEAIERKIAELQAQLARAKAAGVNDAAPAKPKRTRTVIKTAGGAAVEGAVDVRKGDFIGRDSIRIVNQVVRSGEDAKAAQLALGSYLHALTTDLAGLRLGDIDASTDQTRQTPLQLPDIYVPLNTTLRIPEGKTLEKALAAKDVGEMLLGTRSNKTEMRRATALEALAACPRLTLLGAPGGGKSSFGAHVLLTLAQAWQGKHKQLDGLGKRWPHGALLPVRVVLRRFAESHAGNDKKLTAGDLWQFIGQDLHDGGWGAAEQAMGFVQRLAREHGALVLFDGLDECGDAARRDRVMVAVQAFMKSEARLSRFLLTARPYAFPAGADPKQGVFELAEFDDEQISAFITRWYAALAQRGWRNATVAAAKRDELIAACPRADLLPLARNPLLLTLMATLHSNRGRLPDDRVQLYEETVDLLLQRWNKDVGADRALLDALGIPTLTLGHLRSVLEALALQVHEANAGESGLAEIGEDQLVRAFRPLLGGSKDKADQVVEFIERRAGLLLGHGEKADGERRFTFPHRTFQEFLAACQLSASEDFAKQCRRLCDTDAGHWRVVLPLAARLAKPERGASAADELVGGIDVDQARKRGPLTPAHWARALMAGMQLQEIGTGPLAASERNQAILERVKGWLVVGLPLHPDDGGAPAAQRALAGDVLAALGDPRFDADRWHLPADADLGFVRIPADPAFVIGTRAADRERVAQAIGETVPDGEINDEPLAVGEFWISRHLVTVAQFQAFVDATGPQPEDSEALRGATTRPVRYVSWDEASRYCGWLSEQLAVTPLPAASSLAQPLQKAGLQVSLPSEVEWELAARGEARGQVFSWGDAPDTERANVADTGILEPSAVGCFATNGVGLHDMLGNVLEWTRSSYESYPYRADDPHREDVSAGQEWVRVVRGGAFSQSADYARCGYRFRLSPGARLSRSVGFRVVLRSAPVLKR